jgi:hypothetical protein
MTTVDGFLICLPLTPHQATMPKGTPTLENLIRQTTSILELCPFGPNDLDKPGTPVLEFIREEQGNKEKEDKEKDISKLFPKNKEPADFLRIPSSKNKEAMMNECSTKHVPSDLCLVTPSDDVLCVLRKSSKVNTPTSPTEDDVIHTCRLMLQMVLASSWKDQELLKPSRVKVSWKRLAKRFLNTISQVNNYS